MSVYNQGLPGCWAMEIKGAIVGENGNTNGVYIHRAHKFYYQYKRILKKNPESDDKLVVFINHPYNRFTYYWNRVLNIPENGAPIIRLIKGYLEKYTDLNDFIVNGEEDYHLISSLRSAAVPVFHSMSFFCDGDWDIYDNIYNCEDVDNELARMCSDYSITVEGGLEPLTAPTNFSSPFDSDNLTQAAKDLIYERHKPDFDQFGFTR
jgi:hypothetical protein